MRRLLIPAAAAVAIHGMILALGGSWLDPAALGPRPAAPLAITLQIVQPADQPAPKEAAAPRQAAFPPRVMPPPTPPAPRAKIPLKPPATRFVPAAVPKTGVPPRVERAAPSPPAADTPSAEPAAPPPKLEVPDYTITAPPSQPATPRFSQTSARPAEGPYHESDAGAATGITKAVPKYKVNPPPRYPSFARRRGYEGTVILEVLVTREGRAGELKIHQSSGHTALDDSALEAVQGWLFEPAARGGTPVPMWVLVPIAFELR